MTKTTAAPELLLRGDTDLHMAVRHLVRREPRFGEIVGRHGMPPLWPREPGFGTLALLMLEQQVSLAQARTMFQRIVIAAGEMTPRAVHSLGEEGLRAIGVTRQKSSYLHRLAAQLVDESLDLRALEAMPDAAAIEALDALHGVGLWTAQCYLLFALRRADVFPCADLALMESVRVAWRLRSRPGPDAMQKRAEAWRPWRAVAARLLWHRYLSEPRQAGRSNPRSAARRRTSAANSG